MKKINVGKLVELKKKEAENIKAQDFEWTMAAKGYRVDDSRAKTLSEQLREIRTEIKAEGVKLEEAIKTAEGRATARTIDAQDVADALREVESYLHISKKALKGTKARIDCNAQTFPSAYKWTPESTIFHAEFNASGWYVTEIERATTFRKKYCINLSDTAKEAILKNAITLGE